MRAASDRRTFLRGATVTIAGAGGAALLGACGASGGPTTTTTTAAPPGAASTANDHAILAAAQLAEALAVTTYTNIIDSAPFFANLRPAFQNYFTAARQEEMSHYELERSLTRKPAAVTSFFYPPKMFADAQTTLDTLVALEDAFIAAYVLGVRSFSTPDLRVTAARIMGVESDHRVLARVVAPNVAAKDGGPITEITGLANRPERVDPANNNTYERELNLLRAADVTAALGPFTDRHRAEQAGFNTDARFDFVAFKPKLPEAMGAFDVTAGEG